MTDYRVRSIVILLLLVFLGRRTAHAQDPGDPEEGIPVTDPFVKSKCGGCHRTDDRGNMQRISWERSTPEGWNLAIQRMILLADVELTPAETAKVIQYLSTRHGLAPQEARGVLYDVERRIHEETGVPGAVATACGRCHNLARVLSWRRSAADWKELIESHSIRYNAPASHDAVAFLSETAPLHTPEWTEWTKREAGRSPEATTWEVTASALGRIRYVGEITMEPSGNDGEFNTRTTMRSVENGSIFVRTGRGILYGGYAWRGFSTAGTGGSGSDAAPETLANDAREVMTVAAGELTAEGRWFWGQYQELGFDVKLSKSTSTTLSGISRASLKAGSQSNRFRLFGSGFPQEMSSRDIDFGAGTTVQRIVSNTATEVVVEVDASNDAQPGKRDVLLSGAKLPASLTIYDHLDYISVTPDSALAAFSDASRTRGFQQFEAIGYLNGPDGRRHTADDVEVGPIDADWSLKVFYENAGSHTEIVGSVSSTGFFAPARESPENNFDVWVIAEAATERDKEGKPLVGKSYLVVTVASYTFNGRRYVRDLNRWIDDGPAR